MNKRIMKIMCSLLVAVLCLSTVTIQGSSDYKAAAEVLPQTDISSHEQETGHKMASWINNFETGEATRSCPDCSFTETKSLEYNYYNEFYATIYDSYVYTIKNGEAIILDYLGSAPEVVIPSEIEGCPVTNIYEYSFDEYSHIESVIIPDTVTSIGNAAFEKCTALREIRLPASLMYLGESTFRICKALESIIIPDTVTAIENSTFWGCIKLKSIILPSSLVSIGSSAFRACNSLAEITLPETLEVIDRTAFAMTAIEKLNIPSGVSSISADMFEGGKCEKIVVDESNPYYCSDEYGFVFNKDMTELVVVPVNTPVVSYTIPDGVAKIGDMAFCVTLNLKEVIMPDSVTEIGDLAFYQVPYLEKITFSKNLVKIGSSAFVACSLLDNIVLPETLKSMGDYAFTECYSLRNLTILSKNTELGNTAFGSLYMDYADDEARTELAAFLAHFLYVGFSLPVDQNMIDEVQEKLSQIPGKENPTKDTCTVYCYDGSTAHAFAVENNVAYVLICDHEEEILPAVPPTCGKTGLTEGSACKHCGEVYIQQEVVPATGLHAMGEWTVNGNVKTRTCSVCSTKETVVETDDGNVEIEAPENPDHDFEVDEFEKGGDNFVLVEETVNEASETETEVLKVFDINLKNHDGVHVQPDGSVKVKLPLDWEKNGNYKVYRVNDDGTLTDMKAFRQGSHMVFETDHFSIYVIVEEVPAEEEKPQPDKNNIFDFLIRIIRAIEEFFIAVLEILGF